MIEEHICVACGTLFPPASIPPAACPICEDERQFVPAGGQAWTTRPALARSHAGLFRREGELVGIGTSPSFGIGQRALLVRSPHGNLLWDCVSLVDPLMVEIVQGLGGIAAIAISHPHYYTAMRAWSRAFGGVPIHLHARDRSWVMDPAPEIAFWSDEQSAPLPGLTLVRTGGHFAGGTVLHWADGADGRGVLLSGDLVQINPDRTSVGFMRSYPNSIPLGAAAVRRIAHALAPLRFEAIYGAFFDRIILAGGRQALDQSVERHLRFLASDADD